MTFNLISRLWNNLMNDTMGAADEVVAQYYALTTEIDTTETIGNLAEVGFQSVDDLFGGPQEVFMRFDLGEYGEYTVTLDIESELPEFLATFDFDVVDLPDMVENGFEVGFQREAGEWAIDYSEAFE